MDEDLPKIIRLQGDAVRRWGGRTMVVPAPREVDALMQTVPSGRVVTTHELRKALAVQHGVETACPVTTGIFAWIAAHAAAEAAEAGERATTPYWRTLKPRGELNPKYPGGIPAQAARLKAEGHLIRQKGQRYFVADFEQRLAEVEDAAKPAVARAGG